MCIQHINSTSIEGIQFSNTLCDSINDQMVSSYIPKKLFPILRDDNRSFLLGVGKPPTALIKHWRKPIESVAPMERKKNVKKTGDTSWNINKWIETVNLPNRPIIFLAGLAIARRVCCLISLCARNIQPYSTNAQCSPCLGLEQHHISVIYIKKNQLTLRDFLSFVGQIECLSDLLICQSTSPPNYYKWIYPFTTMVK